MNISEAGRIVDVVVEVEAEAEGSPTKSNIQIIKVTPCLFY